VCPHPCEDYCRRGIEDEPVSINQLKRFVADWEMNSGQRLPIACAPDTGKKVAVIGGGPAGVSCAYFLRRLGHGVTFSKPCPNWAASPATASPNTACRTRSGLGNPGHSGPGHRSLHQPILGRDFTIQSLREEGYDAIFLGIGAWKDYAMRAGRRLQGCWKGIEFLSKVAGSPERKFRSGKRCAVVGGGNSAIDCVRTLLRLGAEEVYIVYRRTRKEMPANEVEIVAAEHEGVKFQFLAAPKRVVGDDRAG
jgi:formate dehydrogenase (NADP+) beta subunit